MRIVPDSTITLYGGVDIDNGEQLVFKSRANQTAYFQSKLVRAQTPCTVVRKTGRLRVEIAGSVIATCNYLSFINPHFDNKIVYARIIDYDYINNECVEIAYVIDYWQTWMFDVTFEDMYIEREHLSQADFAKAETNPFDPTIYEFRTAENLPIAKELEKNYYSIGTDNTFDGVLLCETVARSLGVQNEPGVLIEFGEIDFEDLDTGSDSGVLPSVAPSNNFAILLARLKEHNQSCINVGDNTVDFYKITQTEHNYLYGLYPDITLNGHNWSTDKIWSSAAWGNPGSQINLLPINSNAIKAPLNYVYISYSSEVTDPNDEYHSGLDLFNRFISWFTTNGKLESIVGVYSIPMGTMLLSGTEGEDALAVDVVTSVVQNVTNKKLDLYPFSYYRVMSPKGDEKEVHIEDFINVQEGGHLARFVPTLDVIDKPNLLVAPCKYRMEGVSPDAPHVDANMTEGLIFDQFPQLPFSVDGFAARMAAVANSLIGNNTVDYQYSVEQQRLNWKKDVYNTGKDSFERLMNTYLNTDNPGFYDMAKTAYQLGTWGAETGFAGKGLALAGSRMENQFAQVNGAYDVLSGSETNAIYHNFENTRPAYAAAIYHPVNGDGVVNNNQFNFNDIIVLKVMLKDAILQRYDQYFSHYGYASGRCGIPRVINYMHGDTAQADIPAWATVNNKPTTYIKTLDCKVIHSMLPVATFIKNMFDSGVRMIQGDAE